MAEYDRIQKKQESRAIANSMLKSKQLRKKNIEPIQRVEVQSTDINNDIRALANARKELYPQLGVSGHNFAVGESYPDSWAVSNAEGHSEARSAAMTLGILAGEQSIEILSEREPCDSCQSDMENIEEATDNNVDVTVSYLVENDGDAVHNLRDIYEAYK